jgi:hypothetical protein
MVLRTQKKTPYNLKNSRKGYTAKGKRREK